MYELNQQIGVYDPNQQMGMYDPNQQMGMWVESFKGPSCENTGASSILEAGARVDSRVLLIYYRLTVIEDYWNCSSL